MVSIKFWYIKHYGARVGDDIDAKMNYFKPQMGCADI